MNSYRELIVWQQAIRLAIEANKITNKFPVSEFSRKHRQEYAQFLRISFSSGAELEILLLLSKELGFAS